ncbi:MAG: cobalamin biosynthesis protein P47K, partial [Verrucomicrobiae bacterium]
INKCDLLDGPRLESLRQAIATRFPGKEILAVSARNGTNLEEWFGRITSAEQEARTAMQVDYEVYADGEALLGWLNATVRLAATQAFDADSFLKELAGGIQKRLEARQAQVAHLKMTLSPDVSVTGAIAAVNLVRNDFVPELSFHLDGPVTGGQLIVNLRAESAPDVLGTVVREGLEAAAKDFPTMQATLDHLEHFRPGKPEPTHRMRELSA